MVVLLLSLLFSSQAFAEGCCLSSPKSNTTVSHPAAVVFSPNGSCLAVTSTSSGGTVSAFSIDSNCTVTSATLNASTGSGPLSAAFSPNGSCLAVANSGDNSISMFTVNTTTCALTPATGSPFSSVGISTPSSVAFSPTGNCLAVANSGDNSISIFGVSAGCTLTAINRISTNINSPSALAISSQGCIAVTNKGNKTVSSYSIDADCTVTTVGTPQATLDNPMFVAFSPNGRCLAVITNMGVVSHAATFAVSNCTLTPVDTKATGGNSTSAAFSADGSCLAVANATDNTISVFTVNSDCSLTLQGTFPSGGMSPQSVAFSSSGCLAIANKGTGPDLGNFALSKILPQPHFLRANATANCPIGVMVFGNIVDSSGNPLSGVPVTVSGDGSPVTCPTDPNTTCPTDANGYFQIPLPAFNDSDSHTLTVTAGTSPCTVTTTVVSPGRPNCCCPTAS